MALLLPAVPERFTREFLESVLRELVDADSKNRKTFADVELGPSLRGRPAQRLIMRSPDGARWSITVSNAGVVSATLA